MGAVYKTKLRLKAGGMMNLETGVMTGGVTLGHFMTSVKLSAERATLSRALSNGPSTQDTDDDADTATLEIEASRDTVADRNLLAYAAAGGYVEVTTLDSADEEVLARYAPFKFGGFGSSGQKEAATETVTLVGTNLVREAEWVAAQGDMPGGGG